MKLLDLNAVAERLGVCYDTAWDFVNTGKLPHVRLGGRRKIQVREQDLDAFIQESLRPFSGPKPSDKPPIIAVDRRRSTSAAKASNARPHAWRARFGQR
jgi:excisionase family DNA binding protein